MPICFTYENDEGEECECELPSRFEVCPRCEGHGTHLTESIGSHAYSMEEFNESFDEEEREHYFRRGGMYDVRCVECHGARVVSVVDEEACKTPELAEVLKRYERKLADDALYERERAAELRYGC